MANKRQREARKRFREANPGLCPPTPAAPPANGTKKKSKKNKKSMFKKVKKDGVSGGGGGAGRSKHPLRVPGMRPGERCFICKATDHVAKACPEKTLWDKNKICLLCRERGHSLKNCPEKSDGNLNKFCYNCGGSGHSLSKCSKPIENGGTNFASCFVCKQQGHLSKDCPENKHGIYPKGGCCKICGEVTHLARHCPHKRQQDFMYSTDDAINMEGDHQEDHALRGGDDLEDDFIDEEEPKTTKSKKAKQPSSNSATEAGNDEKTPNAKATVTYNCDHSWGSTNGDVPVSNLIVPISSFRSLEGCDYGQYSHFVHSEMDQACQDQAGGQPRARGNGASCPRAWDPGPGCPV